MIEISLDRSYHSRVAEMVSWLLKHVGPGNAHMFNLYVPEPTPEWYVDQIFGHTFIKFKNESDAVQFTLTWMGS